MPNTHLKKSAPYTGARDPLKVFSGGLKISFLSSNKPIWLVVVIWVSISWPGCIGKTHVQAPKQPLDRLTPTEKPGHGLKELKPRTLASLELTDQGALLLAKGKTDEAINMFERAINLDPSNGISYYYLAEAWLSKGDLERARGFNSISEIYLKESPGWALNVKRQQERINDLTK